MNHRINLTGINDPMFDEVMADLRTVINTEAAIRNSPYYTVVLAQINGDPFKLFMIDTRAPVSSQIFATLELDKTILNLEKQFSGHYRTMLTTVITDLISTYENAGLQ